MLKNSKILICGCNGQLGSDCTKILKGNNDIIAVDLPEVDITDANAVDHIFNDNKPDMVINCAAFTNVDACEAEKDAARRVNVDGPGNLAACVEKYGGKLIHISTDYVFDGLKPLLSPYTEDDTTGPVSVYGQTKLAGETAVIEKTSNYAILRTAWLYGITGHNFLKTILRLTLKEPSKTLTIVNDQFGSPTWSYRLALQIEKAAAEDAQGIFHATAEGYCTWYEFAERFLKKMDVTYSIVPCTTEEYPTPAVRPRNSILDNKRLKGKGINMMRDWKSDVDEYVLRFRGRLLNDAKT